MRIGHYSPWLSSPGGVNSYLRRVVRGQVERGHEVVLFNRPSLITSGVASDFCAEIIPTRDDTDLLRQARARGLDALHTHTAVEVPPVVHDLPALIRTMHGHEAYCPSGTRYLDRPNGRPCPRGCHLLGCTWGHFFNRCGSIRPNRFIKDFQRVRLEQRSAKRFFTIAISRFVKEQMVRKGYEASAIRVILHPAPHPPPITGAGGECVDTAGPPLFLFLGRMVPGKGLDWLIRSAAQLDGRVSARFEIIGDGPGKERLTRLCEEVGIAHLFTWLGWVEERAILERLASARAVIFPSLWHEPAGLVTLEAAASGRAVIASRVGGIPEYAQELGNVLLVNPGDTEALAAEISRLAEDPELAGRLGRRGRQRVLEGALSLEHHLDQLEETYARVIGHKPSAVDR